MKHWLLATLALLFAAPIWAQNKPIKNPSNRYAMSLKANEDGTYSLANPTAYQFINLDEVPDLLIPYEARPAASSQQRQPCTTQEFIYKHHDGYSLKLIVDQAQSDKPTPFVIYIHGGGWTGGHPRTLAMTSQYIAAQHGITGVRIYYSLGGQPGANIEVGLEDIRDALLWMQQNAREFNIDPARFGFCGHSAGAHLAAMAAMTIKGTTAWIGNSGPYVLTDSEALAVKKANRKRKDYFFGFTPEAAERYSPICNIPKRKIPATLLVCGTGDCQCEYTHSVRFAEALKERGGKVDLHIYPYYDHNLHGSRSDKAHEILLLMADFFDRKLNR